LLSPPTYSVTIWSRGIDHLIKKLLTCGYISIIAEI
jgi:hypothetical protein